MDGTSPLTKKSRTNDGDGGGGGGGGTAQKFNLAELVMAHAGGDMSRLSSEQLELLCPGMPANVARVLIPILASKGRDERDQEQPQQQSDRLPPSGAPGYDAATMAVAPYREEGYDRSPFGPDLPHPPQVVTKKILHMLSIGDVFACYRTSRAWVNDAVVIMAGKSKAVEDRFACKCAGLHPKILGRYVDLTAVTHAGGTEVRSWSSDPMDLTLIPHLPNLRCFYDPKIDASNLSEGERKGASQESYVVRMLGSHCPLLEVCDLGHQVHDDRIGVEDVTTLLQGCPNLRELTSQNGFQFHGFGGSHILRALKTGPYEELCVHLGFRNPLRDMHSEFREFIDDHGAFEGCITTFPYCYNDPDERRGEFDLKWTKDNFDKESEDLAKRAQEAGFTLNIDPMDWYD